mmetsp:Transcript_21796/g.60585  ORF Transcript_21796/g.60585 Transcript_21796/m.60585 type:complete len:398 (+) Transcript_21796:64-1257(+)
MTIQNSTNNWCPACEEVCNDHPTHCTVCGSELEQPPPPSRPTSTTTSTNQNNENIGTTTTNITTVSPLPDELRREAMARGRELRQMIAGLRQEMEQTGEQQAQLLAQLQNMRQSMRDQWQSIPEHILNPQGGSGSSRPTSKDFLDKIPKVVLKEHSSLLYQSTLTIKNDAQSDIVMQGIMGDFNIEIQPHSQDGVLILAGRQHRTGLRGLDSETKAALSEGSDDNHQFLLLERGDGITFVTKAMLAQASGATACVIANHLDEPWPYVMKDSKAEAKQNGGLAIPTVMIKKSDAAKIYQMEPNKYHPARLDIAQTARDCVVCTETLKPGATVMRLPNCGHVFHVDCVMQWLTKHNTCPFCRREMPTDDEEYEQERRRLQRTHAGSEGSTNAASNDFYG